MHHKVRTPVSYTHLPTNWKNVPTAQGKAVKYPNHWHFSSTTVPCKTARFLTVMDTHGDNRPDMQVVRKGNIIQVGDWTITCNLTEDVYKRQDPNS